MCGITPCRRLNEWRLQRKCTSIHRSICNQHGFSKVQLCHVIWIATLNVDGCRKDPTKGANQAGLSYGPMTHLTFTWVSAMVWMEPPSLVGNFWKRIPRIHTETCCLPRSVHLCLQFLYTNKEKKSLYSIFQGETCVVFISLGPCLSHSPHLSKILRDMFVHATPCFLWDHWSERHGDGGCICGWHRKVNS